MTTLEEFLAGVPLEYKGYKRKCTATLVAPDSVAVEPHRGKAEFATIEPGRAAALYYNLTRRPQ